MAEHLRASPARHLVVYTEANGRGGAEVSLRNLLSELADDFRITVTGVDAGTCEWVARARSGTAWRLLPEVAGKSDWRSMWRLRSALARLRPDIVHANLRTVGDAQYLLAAAVSLREVRVVAVEQLPYPPASRASRFLKRATASRLDAHVAVGERAARLVEAQVGAPEGSVRTIYNGVPDLGPAPRRPPGNRCVFGTLARLDPIKGLDLLLRAAADLPDVDLKIVGEGPARADIMRLADSLGLAARVELLPWSDDARSTLAEFDAFVLPSRNEGFPLSIVEAMLAARPVVATDVGSVGEAIVPGAGCLVPPEDVQALRTVMSALAADPDERERLGAAGRERALRLFTADSMARAFERLYAEIL